jgi:hypothetical protein
MRDYEGKPISQSVTCLTTCYTRPPMSDCEISSDIHKYKEPAEPDYSFFGTIEEI